MIRFALILMLLMTAAVANAGCATQADGAVMAQLVRQTNSLRTGQGRGALRLDRRLSRAAQAHACDLARRQVVSHRDRLGRRPMARIRRKGYRACFAAENVAMGTQRAAQTVQAWRDSPGHARNQSDHRARAMGFGVARGANGRLWWVGVYAAGCQGHGTRAK